MKPGQSIEKRAGGSTERERERVCDAIMANHRAVKIQVARDAVVEAAKLFASNDDERPVIDAVAKLVALEASK